MKVLSHMVNYPESRRQTTSGSGSGSGSTMTRPGDDYRIQPSMKNPRCFMTLQIADIRDPAGSPVVEQVQIVYELYADILPKTCENFMQLCKGTMDDYGRKLHYKNSTIYDIIPDWCMVGGDFINNNGTGGMSIYGNHNGHGENGNSVENGDGGPPATVKNNRRTSSTNDNNGTEFEDESFSADYNQAGLLCMLSHGPHTNTSIFFVTMKPAEWIKGLYVAFGRVVSGLDQLKRMAEKVGTQSGIPKKRVTIVDCGIL